MLDRIDSRRLSGGHSAPISFPDVVEAAMPGIEDEAQFLENAASLALTLYAEDILTEGKSLATSKRGGELQKNAVAAMAVAKSELEKEAAKKAVCAALKSSSEDLKEMTKIA